MNNIYNWIFDQDQELEKNKLILTSQSGDYTFHDIHQRIDYYVSLLESLGDFHRKRVALIVPSVYNFITLVLAISKLGGVSIPVSPLLRKEDLESILDFTDPHIIFTASKQNGFHLGETVQNWAIATNKETVIFEMEDNSEWKETSLTGDKRQIEERDIQVIGCTSGSTGTPKGVVVDADFFKRADEALRFSLKLDENEELTLIGPAVGIYGLCYLLSSLHSKFHLVITESFNFPEVIQLLEANPSRKLMTTPSLFRALDLFSKTTGKPVLGSVKLLCVGGEAITAEFIKTYSNLPLKMMNLYGLTELGPVLYSENDIREDGYLTFLPHVNYKIETPTEEGLGELLFKTVNPFLGYYKRSDLTSEVYKDGWYFSGDIAKEIGSGKVEIIGRKKDMIKKGGQQVIPSEIENFLGKHPAVQKAVVVGIPHPVYGEQIVAFIKNEKELDIQNLLEYSHDRIARYKIPDQIRLVHEWPMIQGKIDKVTLRKMASEQ